MSLSILLIFALLYINQGMLTCSTVRKKDSWLITNFQNLWPRRFTMFWHLCQSALSKPHQIQWVSIHFCCSSNWLLWGTDVLKYELCVDPPALFEATRSVLQSDIPSQANAIQGWVHPSSTQIPRMSVTSKMEMLWSKRYPWKTGQTNESLCGKYTEHLKKEIWPIKVLSVWWLPRWSFYKDNSHLRWKKSSGSNSSYSKEAPQVHCLKNDFLSVKVNQLGYIFVGWWNGDTIGTDQKPPEEYLMEAVHCSCRTNSATPETATEKNTDLMTPDEYYVPMWCLILNKDRG